MALPNGTDFYRILELTYRADVIAIRSAYRSLAKKYHPDVSAFPDAHERFVAITEAYAVLIDPVSRQRYDRTRHSPSPQRASPRNEARYSRGTEARQRSARAKAEEFSSMHYEQFDQLAFDSVVGYMVPKVLGCFGIMLVGLIVFVLLALVVHAFELPKSILIFSLMAFIAVGAYVSTTFDEWHNKRQTLRRRRTRGL